MPSPGGEDAGLYAEPDDPRILVLDDAAYLREFLRRFLRRESRSKDGGRGACDCPAGVTIRVEEEAGLYAEPGGVSDAARILVVDDDAYLREFLKRFLHRQGYAVTVACDAHEALEQAVAARPDLILLDVLMPGLGGLDVCRRLKEMPETRDIPVIFVTSRDEVHEKVEGLDLGAVDYVTKPFVVDEVASRIRAALRTSGRIQERDRQVEELKEKFLSRLSHEMNAPLTVIRGFAELLQMGLARMDVDSQADYLQRIIGNTQRMVDLLADFRCLSRGASPSELTPMDLAEVARTCKDELDGRHQPERVTVVEDGGPLPTVVGHPEYLPRTVAHLLANACRYGGRDTPVRATVAADGARVRLTVEDAGPGLDPSAQERIFERFSSLVDNGASPPGLGIGLAVARTFARSAGGDVTVESAPGQGSRFHLILPRYAGGARARS